ncbi:hypothetical protein H2198_001627 [Neophaeococcomyces mojaviensis]|uniref:Uncharacterized protein n=1 Tax=Neophaeococcomyces mojaviensis TaxID=3383035 RepID=A0ACC3AGP6_9EURO|nr:hypothetical protein H2198_001627 [Knufia sp. JES_112]
MFSKATSNSSTTAGGPQNHSRSQLSRLVARVNQRFDELGMSRRAKIAVVVVISVLSTIETLFWIKVGWRWLRGDDGADAVKEE